MGDSAFEGNQQNYYLNVINRALPITSTVNVTDAIGDYQTGIDPSRLASTFSSSSAVLQRDTACRKINPSGMHEPSSRTGCGWWYVPNTGLQSVGAYGTRRGPMSPTMDRDYGTGEWIWDKADAMAKEGIKAASKIKQCEDIQLSPFPNMGWCPSNNSAVVTDGKGRPAYPTNPRGDCPGDIITDVAQCRRPETGTPVQPGRPGPGLCDPVNGALSPACLRNVVNAQCNSTGTLSVALSSGYAGTYGLFNDMNSVLAERNFTIPSGIINDGRMTVADAVSATSTLRMWAADQDPKNSRTAGAARNLCNGNPFDVCGFSNTDVKPFSATCIARVALAAGWSPSGTAMPANDMAGWNSLATWGDILNRVSTLKSQADTPGPNQLNYIKMVYGISAAYPRVAPPACGVYSSAVTYLPLREDMTDSGKNSQNVIINGNVPIINIAGKPCASFNNNTNNFLAVPAINGTTFTVSYWFLVRTTGYYTMVSYANTNFGDWENPRIQFDVNLPGTLAGPYLAFPNRWSGTNPTTRLSLNTWNNITMVVKGTNMITYLNGSPECTSSGSQLLPPRSHWIIGRSGDAGRAADVCINNFAVWDRELSLSEIQSIM